MPPEPELPPKELWLGNSGYRRASEIKVFESEKDALGWCTGVNPFAEVRTVWRVNIQVLGIHQASAEIKVVELHV